ncbi:MAG: GldG family protein [Bacteroidales bacterium]|nr:GldG family protein [Bacteroidales bacterium]
MKNKWSVSIILIVAILILANLISQDFFLRIDFSEDKSYTLSKATKDLLKQLQEPVTIKAYFSENLPPNVAQGRRDLKDLLVEYNTRSKGMVVYEFINPNENEEKEQEAVQAGVHPVLIDVREKDQMKQQKAYMGVVVSMGERKEVIPFIQPGTAIEYELSKAIKKLSVVDKPTVGLLQGHGEPSINNIIQAYNELTVLYNVEPVNITDTTPVPERIKTLLIVQPKDSLRPGELNQLDVFLARGGCILVAASRVNANLQTAYSSTLNTGLENWLRKKGIFIKDNVLIDVSCSQIQVVQNMGGFQMIRQVQFPYIPVIKSFAKHPVTGGLEAVIMPFTSSIEFVTNDSLKFIPLAFTSEKSASEQLPVYFDLQRQWSENDFRQKNLVVAAAVEGKLVGQVKSKLVCIASGDFIINSRGNDRSQQQTLAPDNVSLFVNSVDWLTDETGLISLRTKAVTSRPLKEVSDVTKGFVKWANFLVPILLVIGYGFFRFQMNRNIRIKRMEENYG